MIHIGLKEQSYRPRHVVGEYSANITEREVVDDILHTYPAGIYLAFANEADDRMPPGEAGWTVAQFGSEDYARNVARRFWAQMVCIYR